MHYGTWDPIKADPGEFCKKVREKAKKKCVVLKPGEEFEVP